MTKNCFYILLVVTALLTSCIPIKDLVYLQDKGSSGIQSTVNAVASKPYRLQVNDVLSIDIKAIDPKLVSIFNSSESSSSGNAMSGKSETGLYFQGYTVDDHGNIRMPMLGEINVIGYTLEEVRNRIEEKLLEEYFKAEANIFVTIKLAGFRYTINGEVGSTGTKVLYKENVNIMEAIANAGDITTVGNRKAVTIIRQTPTGVVMQDIDLTDASVMASPYYNLQPNDYVYVKPLKQKSWGTGQTGIQSIGSVITLLSLATTVYLILKN